MYFEDVDEGATYSFGSYTVTEAEILDFGAQYDPQPIHTDPDAAEDTMFGGLIASGFHTASICLRLLVEGFLDDGQMLGASGLDELRWHEPVYPGDTLTLELDILDKTTSESRRDVGYLDIRVTGKNQDGDDVISWIGHTMLDRRSAG